MKKKIPSDAFDAYFALGSLRTYAMLAKEYGVSRRSIAIRAQKEGWSQRLQALEEKARAASDKKKVETLDERNIRQLQEFRFMEAKAINAFRDIPIRTAVDAARVLELSVREQRLISGDPTERTAISIEDVIKKEYAEWMSKHDADEKPEEPR